MAPKFIFASDVAAKTEIPRVLMRVVRKWLVLDPSHPGEYFCLELVLMDSKGDKIGATIRNQLVYIFRDRLVEDEVYLLTKLYVVANGGEYRSTNHTYKLSFDIKTTVAKHSKLDFPLTTYDFAIPADVFTSSFDVNYLVDLMGILTGVSKEKEYYRNSEKSKMIVIELDNDGYRFKVTLFGDEVDQLNTFVASGDATNAVIVILFAKVKKWQGINSISNNYSTKLLFNPQIPEVQNFKSKMIVRLDTPVKGLSQLQEKTKLSLSDDLLKMTPKATIKHMKDSYLKDKGISGSEPSYFVVLATITEMVDEDMWYYTACSRCTRKATPDSGMYYCGKCKKHIIDVTPSFFLRLRVKDDNSVATFVMFNRDAAEFLKKSCVDMLMEYNMNNESGSLPKELSDLEDKTVLFKVGCDRGSGSRYEPSYIVKRVTDDSDIIQQFINQGNVNPSNEITADLTPQNLQAKSIETEDVAQDLAARFEDTRSDGRVETPDIENNLHDGKVETQDRDVVDLSSDTPVGSNMKRSYPIGENSASLENLKKNIKIEKE